MIYRLSRRITRRFIRRLLIPIISLGIMTYFVIPIATDVLTELVSTITESLFGGLTDLFK